MKRNLMRTLVLAGGLTSAMFAQQYPQQSQRQDPRYQNDANYNGQYDDRQYDAAYDGAYDEDAQGTYAPAPPPVPSYAYQRPVMPGPGYSWIDGYWNFVSGRYAWVGGYWMRPPYAGGYWVSPRYTGGRYYRGFWGGNRAGFNRGSIRNGYNRPGRIQSLPQRGPSGSGFRRNDNDRSRSNNNWGNRGR